jgi:hypothetical protein
MVVDAGLKFYYLHLKVAKWVFAQFRKPVNGRKFTKGNRSIVQLSKGKVI